MPARLLALDPGNTTGWAVFVDGELEDCGQVATTSVAQLWQLIQDQDPDAIVCEAYHVYGNKLAQHAGSDVPTLQLIGAIRLAAHLLDLPAPRMQTAAQAKTFCTDDKLKHWGMYQPGKRHATDAIRHGAYAIIFAR